ncbi:MAG: substrate-binding domain-containing protein [Gemmatimonadota bacterium]
MRLRLVVIGTAAAWVALLAPARLAGQQPTGGRDVILATTSSFRDTGLLDSLLPAFERETGYRLLAIAVGSGQALRMGERGDADVLLVHSPAAEMAFLRAGSGTRRQVVAWNYFAIVGPRGDPARVAEAPSAADALRRIAAAASGFVSRGDSSGTHVREMALWVEAGGRPRWAGYVETGQGMAMTLLVADERGAYTLTDRATLAAFRHRVALVPLRPPEPALLNVYHVIEVSPTGRPRVNAIGARAFADWITSPAVQERIASFGPAGDPPFVAARGREPSP